MNNPDFSLDKVRKIFQSGIDIESILVFLKEDGYSKTQSILIVKKMNNFSLDKAKEIVHFSKTWKEDQEFDTDLNQRFYEVIESEEK
jgi:uncharacterized protein with ParB-like and HNH nuclease domain